MKKTAIIIGAAAIILIVGYLLLKTPIDNLIKPPKFSDLTREDPVNVEINNFSFNPRYIRVKAGAIINWTNNDSIDHLVASDPHPGHTNLPGFESPSLAPGASYSFIFDKLGAFDYHCHFHPSIIGKIIVEQK